jgi:prolyl oligopeptidase
VTVVWETNGEFLRRLAILAVVAVTGACAPSGTPAPRPPAGRPAPAFDYPATAQVEQVDDYHGVAVADPYRWLEEIESPATRAWIAAQNRHTAGYLGRIAARPRLRQRLAELWSHERLSPPLVRGGRYFFTRHDGVQNQAVVYVLERLDGEPRPLIDPNPLAADSTVALADFEPSPDGRRVAYALATAGSDWLEWRVRDVESGEDLPDLLRWSKFSRAAWTHDSKGFFYGRYTAPPAGEELLAANYWQKLYYHRLGTTQDKDLLVYDRRDHRDWGFDARVTDDGRFLVIHAAAGTDPKNAVFYKDLRRGVAGGQVVELLGDLDAHYELVGNDGWVFWLHTDRDAPRGRLVAVDARAPAPEHWRQLVAEGPDTLQGVTRVGDRLFARYLRDARARVAVFDLGGKPLGDLELPGVGNVEGFTGDRRARETFYTFESFTAPAGVWRYDLASGRASAFRSPRLAFDPAAFETRQVFYTSRDGTRVPMFLCHRRGLDPDGDRPALLYGYGGFGIPRTPEFSPAQVAWMEAGGVLAVASLRGGGEYGEEWHQAGTRLRKQNVFDDAIAAAEWLIDNRYTRRERLAVIGRSNGGLLVGALLTQRPDLFAAAVPIVGVLDMLRYPEFTIGWAWVSDYGSPDDPQEFAALHAYSPLHNTRPGTAYPATLLVTGDHDDRVFPAHSLKFAAALQAAQAGARPILLRVDVRAGHGSGKPTQKQIEEWTDILSFLVENLNVTVETPPAP